MHSGYCRKGPTHERSEERRTDNRQFRYIVQSTGTETCAFHPATTCFIDIMANALRDEVRVSAFIMHFTQ